MAHEARRFTLVFAGVTTDADELLSLGTELYKKAKGATSAELTLDADGFSPQRTDIALRVQQVPEVVIELSREVVPSEAAAKRTIKRAPRKAAKTKR